MSPSKELVINASSIAPNRFTPYEARQELTFNDLWEIVLRRKAIIIGALAIFVGAAMIVCATTTRLYLGRGEVQVQKDGGDALGLDNMVGSPNSASDALDANITLQTQAQLLQSDTLALRVIRELDLEHTADFRPKFNPIGWVMGLMSVAGPADPRNAALDDSPTRRTRVVKIFESHLKVQPMSGTRLIEVSYLHSDPKVAAEVVNRLVRELVNYNFQTRQNATQEAVGWLGNQLSDLRKQSEDLQTKVVHLQHDSGVFTLGQTDMQGREQIYTPVLDRLQQATTQLTQAQSARIMKGALYNIVKDGDPELISGLSGSGMLTSASAGVSGSLSLIQSLRAQEASAQAQLNGLEAKFGPGYPKLAEVKANLQSTQAAIKAETARVAGRAKNDYAIAEQIETGARSEFSNQKRQANSLNDKAVEYEIVRQEALQSRTLYESLLGRLKEADLVAGLRSTNITLVDPARQPSTPAKPNVPLYMAASLAGGLVVGMCFALFRDATDTTIQDSRQLETHLGGMPLGILPRYKQSREPQKALPTPGSFSVPLSDPSQSLLAEENASANSFAVLLEPRAPFTEAMRILRTSLTRGIDGEKPQVILMTSSISGEGKSMLSANLAILLAQQGSKVLLVDSDLRTPVLQRRLNLRVTAGLSSILSSDKPSEMARSAAIPMIGMPNLKIVAAGPVPDSPAELLSSPRMGEAVATWRKDYDFIIIDAPPVLPVTDSVLLSAHADLTLVVARQNMTQRQSLDRTCSILQLQGAQNVRVVLNAMKHSSTADYDYGYAA